MPPLGRYGNLWVAAGDSTLAGDGNVGKMYVRYGPLDSM